ncbi:MAG: FAD-binding oxidoreductase [bacterium]|nr:FAD-binding oxidoreductase [bacterium]
MPRYVILERMSLGEDLKLLIHGEVAEDKASLARASRDASLFIVRPRAVVHPMNVDDVKALVRYASTHKHISLTARSGGTDMSGGPLSESLVVDMTSHFTRIGSVTNHSIYVEPGVYYRDMERKVRKKGLLMPSFPASKDICTVGGMVNNNSGGEKTLSYGKTERYVEELSVVLADGNEYTISPLTASELAKKIQEKTFIGKVYKEVYALCEKHYDFIHSKKPDVSKNSAGYSLWNVWDRKTFDVAKLFVGSQGTLGITTNIKFRLIKPKKHSAMLVVFLPDLTSLIKIVEYLLAYQPTSLESYDDHTLSLALKLFPSFVKKLKTNVFSLAWQFIPEFFIMLRFGIPKLIVLAEFSGDTKKEAIAQAEAARNAIKKWNVPTRIATSKEEKEKYWTIRRESFNMLRHHVQGKKTAPFIDDFIVKPIYLQEFLPQLAQILQKYNIDYSIAGHVGDGNFHIIPLMNLKDEQEHTIIPKVSKEVYDLVFRYKGSSTAEHNDGLVRSHILPQMYGEKMYGLFKETKHIFDPKNIFNPGKKVNFNWKWSQKHIAKE